jgi:hypothetical protein
LGSDPDSTKSPGSVSGISEYGYEGLIHDHFDSFINKLTISIAEPNPDPGFYDKIRKFMIQLEKIPFLYHRERIWKSSTLSCMKKRRKSSNLPQDEGAPPLFLGALSE